MVILLHFLSRSQQTERSLKDKNANFQQKPEEKVQNFRRVFDDFRKPEVSPKHISENLSVVHQ